MVVSTSLKCTRLELDSASLYGVADRRLNQAPFVLHKNSASQLGYYGFRAINQKGVDGYGDLGSIQTLRIVGDALFCSANYIGDLFAELPMQEHGGISLSYRLTASI